MTEEKIEDQDIQPLTDEEVQTLQSDAALRKIGQLDAALVKINRELAEKLEEYSKAKIQLEIVKAKREMLIERCRNLKAFVKGAQINL